MKNYTILMNIVVLALCSLLIICCAGETGAQEADVETYMNQGKEYINARQADPAIEAFTKAIELDPTYVEAYLYRGYVYGAIEQYELAVADYTKIIELTPEDAGIYNRRGLMYGEMGQTEQELADYTKAIELDPSFAVAYRNRGFVYRGLGQFEQALADYTKAIELEPEHVGTYTYRGRVYAEMEQYEQALADYAKSIELAPEYVNVYYDRAETFFKMGKCDDARKDFRQIQQLGYVVDLELATAVEKQCPTYVFELDTPQNAEDPKRNVVKTSLESDGTNLYMTLMLKEEIAKYQERKAGVGAVLYIHIDTDSNRDTGGVMAHSGYDSGFEYFITLGSCLKLESGISCSGTSMNWQDEGLFEEPVLGFFSSYSVYRYTQQDDTTEEVHDLFWNSPREDITGNIVKTVIPYTEIGVVPGQIIRIVTDERFAENAQSPDILLTLK